MAGEAAAGSCRAYRLDPETLPVRSFPRGDEAAVSFIIERERTIIIHRQTAEGTARMQSVPLSDYRGVSIRIDPLDDEGAIRAHIELLHRDPSLTLPLVVTEDADIVERDWMAWGRTLGLPLLIIGLDRSVGAPLGEDEPTIRIAPQKPRRYSVLSGRRPRFLTRRKTGRTLGLDLIDGREIIARD